MKLNEIEEEVYDVEKIVKHRMHKGRKQYLIKWVGYPDSDNTWEDIENLMCSEMLEEYEAQLKEKRKEKDRLRYAKSTAELRKKRRKEAKSKAAKEKTESANNIKDTSSDELLAISSELMVEKKPIFKQQITNEWDADIDKVTGAFVNSAGLLEIEFVFNDGSTGSALCEEFKYKAPLKLLKFYEDNLTFRE